MLRKSWPLKGILILMVTLSLAEIGSRLLPSPYLLPESARSSNSISPYVLRDSPVFEFKPNIHFVRTVVDRVTGRLIYSSEISTDLYRRRRISRKEKPVLGEVYLVGDSFTFGTGVNDSETFGQNLQELLPSFRILNFGLPAAGPQDVLEDYISGERWTDISKQHAIAIYTSIDNHLERLLCKSWRCFDQDRMRDRTPDKTRYEIEEGQLINRGPFRNSLSTYDRLQWLLSFSRLLALSSWDSLLYREEDYLRYGQFIAKLRDQFAISGIRFVYVFFPGWSARYSARLSQELEKLKVEFIDYSKVPLQSLVKGPIAIEGDGHPSPSTYRVYAGLLKRDLFKSAN